MTPRFHTQPAVHGQGMTSQRARDRMIERLAALLLNGCGGPSRPSAPSPSSRSGPTPEGDATPPESTDESRSLLRGDPTR